MAGYFRGRLAYTWLFLSVVTLVSAWLGAQSDRAQPRVHALLALLVLLIAVVKCRVVMRSFMEVRLAPSWLQRTCDAWLLLNLGMTSAFYWGVS